MDTKERRNRNHGPSSGSASGGTGQRRRRTTATRQTAPQNPTAARSGERSRRRKRQPMGTENRQRRNVQTVRPPREPVPEVRYTMPKPVSRGAFLLRLATVVAVAAALIMCLSLFFRVEEVVVSGSDKYTPWMVMEASGISKGDSLLTINDARITGKIISALPYVKEARVGVKLPGTVQIEIAELEMTYAIEAVDNTWWLIAADGRVIESIEPTAASGYTRIIGVQADGPRKDQPVQAAEEHREEPENPTEETVAGGMTLPVVEQITGRQRLEVVLTILQNLESNGVIGQIASIDVTNLNNVTMEYGSRLHIVLGKAEDLPYKIAYMARAVEQLATYETGELDVSFKFSEQALLNPKG